MNQNSHPRPLSQRERGGRAYTPHIPTDHVVIVYTLSADGCYGKPVIHETRGTLAAGLFPDLLIEWERVFQDSTVQPSSPPTKDLA